MSSMFNADDEDFKSSSDKQISKSTCPRKRQLEEDGESVKKVATIEDQQKPSTSSAVVAKKEESSELETVDDRIPLSKLVGDVITSKDIERLKENGICTMEAVAQSSTRRLSKIFGISENKAALMVKTAKKMVPTGYVTAGSLFGSRADVIFITTGSSKLDTLLRGGIETGSMTEIFGENGSGKTQICCTLAVTCQLPVERGGAEGKCLYIDSEGAFRPERLVEIAQRYDLNVQEALNNVSFARGFNCEQLMELLTTGAAMLSESRYALVIVDSATSLYRTEYSGRGELHERQNHLGQFLRTLRRLCDEYGVAVVYTNQVVADVGSLSLFAGSTMKAVGGNIMGHASTTRLSIRKGRGDNRVCKVYSSPTIPSSEEAFAITGAGVCDVKD